MAEPDTLHLSTESRVRLPTPDEAINIGYAFHAVNDPDIKDHATRLIAELEVERFLSLREKPDTPDDAYLSCVRGIVLSLARGITRRKSQYIKELEIAQRIRDKRERDMRDSFTKTAPFGAWSKLLVPLVLGISGYLFAKIIGSNVPPEVTEQTGKGGPTAIMILLFLLVGRFVTFTYQRMHSGRIEDEYDSRCFLAFQAYELGKLDEQKLYRAQLCEAWQQYTGEEYPQSASYQMIIQGDIQTRHRLEQHRLISNMNDLQRIMRFMGDAVRKRNGRKTRIQTLS